MDPSVLTGNAKADEFYKQHIDGLAAALANFFKDRTADEYKEKIAAARRSGRTYLLLNNRLLDFQEKKKVLSFPLFKEAKIPINQALFLIRLMCAMHPLVKWPIVPWGI